MWGYKSNIMVNDFKKSTKKKKDRSSFISFFYLKMDIILDKLSGNKTPGDVYFEAWGQKERNFLLNNGGTRMEDSIMYQNFLLTIYWVYCP